VYCCFSKMSVWYFYLVAIIVDLLIAGLLSVFWSLMTPTWKTRKPDEEARDDDEGGDCSKGTTEPELAPSLTPSLPPMTTPLPTTPNSTRSNPVNSHTPAPVVPAFPQVSLSTSTACSTPAPVTSATNNYIPQQPSQPLSFLPPPPSPAQSSFRQPPPSPLSSSLPANTNQTSADSSSTRRSILVSISQQNCAYKFLFHYFCSTISITQSCYRYYTQLHACNEPVSHVTVMNKPHFLAL